MKFTPAAVIASLALNAGLLAYYYLPDRNVQAAVVNTPVVPAPPAHSEPELPLTPEVWKSFQSGTDSDFVARLRAEAFPPQIIHSLVYRRVRARYADLQAALNTHPAAGYWRENWYSWSDTTRDPVLRKKRRELESAIYSEVKSLLGENLGYTSQFQTAQQARLFGNLSEEKIKQVQRVESDYAEMMGAIRGSMQGVTFPEDHEQLALLEKEKAADLAAVLNAEELEEYNYRSSPLARGIRNQLSEFDPSEDEFKALVRVQKSFEEKYAHVTLSSDDSRELREAEVKSVLSPERFEDYQIKTSGSYGPVKNLVQHFGLPVETTSQVVLLQRKAVQQALEIRDNRVLTEAQKSARLAEIAETSTSDLSSKLPGEALDSYLSSPAGAWLKRLKPKPNPSKG